MNDQIGSQETKKRGGRGALLLLLLGAFGCDKSTPQAASDADGAVPPSVRATICEADCAGPLASIIVWRNSAGGLERLELQGDIERCSHPPTIFFDAAGQRLDAIPMVPVEPGSAEARRFDEIRARNTGGLTRAESLSCRE